MGNQVIDVSDEDVAKAKAASEGQRGSKAKEPAAKKTAAKKA